MAVHGGRFAVNLLGDFEDAVRFGAVGFNPRAKTSVDWTREQLSLPAEPAEKNRELWSFLGRLAKQHLDGDVGAASQSRDGDFRPAYVIQDGNEVRFRRLKAAPRPPRLAPVIQFPT